MNTRDEITALIQRRLREIDSEIRVLSRQRVHYQKMLELSSDERMSLTTRKTSWKMGAQKDVLEFLKRQPNMKFPAWEIAEQLKEPDTRRVANAANALVRRGKVKRERVVGTRTTLYWVDRGANVE